MRPAQLSSASFAAYPQRARALAGSEIALFRVTPVVILAILLKELMVYDWKMPAERQALDRQLRYLSGAMQSKVVEGFRSLQVPVEISESDWVNNPSGFIEKFTAWLWSTHGIEGFRGLAEEYATAVNAAFPERMPSMHRLGIVVIGDGVNRAKMPLFRKLRPGGVLLTHVVAEEGLAILKDEALRRAGGSSEEFLHWSIDGGGGVGGAGLTQVSYAGLDGPRMRLLQMIQGAVASGKMGPEELRSMLARTRPEEIGLAEGALSRFQMSLLTEGAGTQIFSTTFVQWAARECVRRAQPETLLVRFTARQTAQTMNRMLSGEAPVGVDVEGSLVDADMGAYYTWLNLRRLTGAEELRFLVWFEGHTQAIVIGPGLPRGTISDSRMNMAQVLKLLA